jgi:hypothetical protein
MHSKVLAMAAVQALLVTGEAPVLRVPNRPDKCRHAPSLSGKVRHLAGNVQQAEAVPEQPEAVAVAEEVVVVAGERMQRREITRFAIGIIGLTYRCSGH